MNLRLYILIFSTFILFTIGKAQPTFSVTSINSTSVISCANPTLNFIATTHYTNGVLSCTWTNGNTILTGTDVVIGTPGSYTILGKANGAPLQNQALIISSNTVQPQLAITPLSQTINCSLASITDVTVSSTTFSTGAIHRFISPYGGMYSANSPTHAYTPFGPGTYTYSLIDSANGCSSVHLFTVNSTDQFPTAQLVSPQNFTLGCATRSLASITLTNMVGSNLSYSIFGPSVLSSTGTSFTLNTAGTRTISVLDNQSMCEIRIPVTVLIDTIKPNIFTIVPTNTLNCLVTEITIQGLSSIQNSFVDWNFYSDMLFLVSPIITIQPKILISTIKHLEDYYLHVINRNNACEIVSPKVSIYQDIYMPRLNVPSPFDVKCPSPTVTIFPTITGSPQYCNYLWNYPVSANVTGINTPSLITDSPGIYTITLSNPSNKCSVETEVEVQICVSSKEELNNSSLFRIYPNPVIDKLFLLESLELKHLVDIEIYNDLGQLVLRTQKFNSSNYLDVSNLKQGLYFLNIVGSQNSLVKKFVVSR